MKPQNYECRLCFGRETHCESYIDGIVTRQIKLGEPCLFYVLWNLLLLNREVKRLGLENQFVEVETKGEEIW